MGAIKSASIARSSSSIPNERCRPRSPAKVNVTQSTPGARSMDETAVGSHAKKKITSPSSANMTTDRNALRVRSSIARSFRATIHDAARKPGALVVMTAPYELPVVRGVSLRVERKRVATPLEPREPSLGHDCRVRRECEPFAHVVRDDDERRPTPSQRPEQRRERG